MRAELLGRLLRDRREKRPVVLVTWLASGEQALAYPGAAPPALGAAASDEVPPASGAAASDEVPPASGAAASGEGEASGAALDGELAAAAGRAIATDESSVVDAGPRGEVLLEPFNPPLRLIVVGAVHIAQPLAKMAPEAGFAVAVVDPRKAFASEERFPGVACLRAWPGEAFAELAPDRRTAVVTLTHDPKIDDVAIEASLRSPAFYIGCLGSQKTHRARLERLAARGFGEAELARLHGPVGLRIGAKTPAEIAISVLAQIVERLRAGAP
jgi:xanthine dehydrogenase accessory factor